MGRTSSKARKQKLSKEIPENVDEESEHSSTDKENENNSAEFEVEKIVHTRLFRGKRQYLIRWKGYGEESDSWETESALESSAELLEAFKKQNILSDEITKNEDSNSEEEPLGKKKKSPKKGIRSSQKNKGKKAIDSELSDMDSQVDTNTEKSDSETENNYKGKNITSRKRSLKDTEEKSAKKKKANKKSKKSEDSDDEPLTEGNAHEVDTDIDKSDSETENNLGKNLTSRKRTLKDTEEKTATKSANTPKKKKGNKKSKRSEDSDDESVTDEVDTDLDKDALDEDEEPLEKKIKSPKKVIRSSLKNKGKKGIDSDLSDIDSQVESNLEKFDSESENNYNRKTKTSKKKTLKETEVKSPTKSANTPKKKKESEKPKKSEDSDDEPLTDGNEYEVEKILEVHFRKDGTREFLIRWKGYKPSDDTWEPEEHLDCEALIEKFMERVKKAKNIPRRELRELQQPRKLIPHAVKHVKNLRNVGVRPCYQE